jgi:hypothetical protein
VTRSQQVEREWSQPAGPAVGSQTARTEAGQPVGEHWDESRSARARVGSQPAALEDSSESRSCREADLGTRFLLQAFDRPPLRDNNLQLLPEI